MLTRSIAKGFEIASLRQRPGIDRLEAELGHQAGYHLFGVGVAAAQEHAQGLMAVARI